MIVGLISQDTSIKASYIYDIISSASHRYKVYYIPKRTEGLRKIEHPAVELKLIQRWILENLLSYLPVHGSVYSYKKGIGIRDLANVHRKNRYSLKVDFKNFFPSIKSIDIAKLLKKRASLLPIKLSDNDIRLILNAVCRNRRLTIGAPSSPSISNAILNDFDRNWFLKAQDVKAEYTRYADDLFFSANKEGVLLNIFKELEQDINKMKSPKLVINNRKTVFSSRKYRRVVTGLIITPDQKISVGRKTKRYIKSLIFQYKEGKLDKKLESYLKGYISYINSVEPKFLKSLYKKYGKEVMLAIKNIDIKSQKHY